MKKKLRKVLIIGGGILLSLLLLLVITSLVFYYNKKLTKGILLNYLKDKKGVKVEIGKIDYGLFPLNIQADSVRFVQKMEEVEIDVFLSRINLKGEVKRILRKEKPFFDSIEITGAVCRVKKKEGEKKKRKIDYQENILKFSSILSYVSEVIIRDSSLELATSSQHTNLQNASFFLSESGHNGEYDYSFSSEKAHVEILNQRMSFDSLFRSTGKFSLAELPFIEAEIFLGPLNFTSAEKELVLQEMEFTFRSEFQPDQNLLFFPQLEIDIPPLIEASGSLKIDLREDFSFYCYPKIHLKDLNRTYDLLRPYISQKFKYFSAEVKGAAYLEGEYQYIKNSSKGKSKVRGLVKLSPTQINYSAPGFSFDSLISGEVRIRGSLSDLKFSGALKGKHGNFSNNVFKVQNFSFELPLNGTGPFFDTPGFKGRLRSLAFSPENKKIELNQVEFKGQGDFDLSKRKINLIQLEFQVPSFPSMQIEANVDLQPQGEKYIRLESSNIDFESLFPLFSPFLPEEIPDWEPDGHFNIEMEVRNSPQNGPEWYVSSVLDLSDVMFHNPSSSLIGESLHSRIEGEGKYHPFQKSILFSLSLDLSQGESLWNDFYLDWSKNSFKGKVTGVYHLPLRELDDLAIDASFSSLGRIEARGLLKFKEPYPFDLTVSISQLDLPSFYNFFSQEETLDQPSFDLEGEAESQVRLKGEKNKLSLNGQVLLKDGFFETKDKEILVEGIEAKIPIDFERGIKKSDERDKFRGDKGYILARKFKTPYFSINPLQIDFSAGRNTFQFEPFSAEIFGGKATLGESVLSLNSNLSNIKGTLSLSLSDVDLSKLPIKSNQFNLRGTARANLFRMELTPKMVSSQGSGEIDAFGGKITVQNIKITKPFSKYRTVSCDVDFEDLNLEKLTDSIPFGRVTGIIRGEIKDLAFSGGLPLSFILRLESVKRKGVTQKFSLGAVNDLAVISSGENTSLSATKGLARFASEFYYKKIGIFCSLENNVFILRGTIREKGAEYLVKRSWLFGISVINKMPQNRISFQDMVDRLKRIGRSRESR